MLDTSIESKLYDVFDEGRKVYYMLNLKNVSRIDLPREKFYASIKFDFRWRPTDEEWANFIDEQDKLIKQPKFTPANKIYAVINGLTDTIVWDAHAVEIRTIRPRGQEKFFGQRLIVSGEFFTNYDLQDYPADTQSLTVGFKIRSSHMYLIPLSFGDMRFAKVRKHVFSKAYCYANFMIEQGVPKNIEKTRGRATYYYLYVTMVVSRNPLDFVLRRVSWLLMFSISTFGVYTISNENIGERMTYLITIILIFSAYSVVLSGMLPEVPYYTHADDLIISHAVFVFFFTVLIGFGSPEICNFSKDVEIWIGRTLCVIWVAYNSIWFIRLVAIRRKASTLAQRPYTETADDSDLIATMGTKSERKKDGVFLYSLQKIKSTEWPKTEGRTRFSRVLKEHISISLGGSDF